MRAEVNRLLKTITPNVFQEYPDQDESYPCLVYGLTMVGNPDMDGIGYFECDLSVDIYAKSSAERSLLEMQLIVELIKYGWVNRSNNELPHPDYYRNNLTFTKIYQGGI